MKKRAALILLLGVVFSVGFLMAGGASDEGSAQGKKSEKSEQPLVLENHSPMAVVGENEDTVSFRQADGTVVDLPKNPQKSIILLNSLLDLWYMSGGTSLARLKGTVSVPPEAMDLPVVGRISSINLEMIMEMEPDFVVVSTTSYQDGVRNLCRDENIPVVSIAYRTFDDFQVIMDLFTRLTLRRDIYDTVLEPIKAQVASIINQVPKDVKPTVCILFSGTKYVKVETPNTIAGSMCEQLKAENIYKDQAIDGATRVDMSLEYIFEQDPDVILVTTMGDVEKCKARVQQDVESSDIWGELSAVKNGRYIYLDKSYSIYKPNRFYPEAYKTMAEFLYPDTTFILNDTPVSQ